MNNKFSAGNFNSWLKYFFNFHNISETERKKIILLPYSDYNNFTYPENKTVIFEDWWIRKPEIVKSKISSLFGKNKRVFARKCEIRKINKEISQKFTNQNHIYGSTDSKHGFMLFENENPVACATFAGTRNFKTGKSGELLRFCNKTEITVVGGLSRLIKAYSKLYNPDDIMTYIDLDWGNGNAFKNFGFIPVDKKEGIKFYCNRESGKRIPEKYFTDFKNISDYEVIRNSGSRKFKFFCIS